MYPADFEPFERERILRIVKKFITPEGKVVTFQKNAWEGLKADTDPESLYYEPFYQLMRQTLLGWKMAQAGEYQCDEYIHVHVIPENNVELRERVTSPRLKGDTMSEAWKSVLREPGRYKVISPEEFMKPAFTCPDTQSIKSYLQKRYWRKMDS